VPISRPAGGTSSGAEEIADDVHAVHERAFDHLQRPLALLARFLGVLDDVLA
jgi:hypothetical protein